MLTIETFFTRSHLKHLGRIMLLRPFPQSATLEPLLAVGIGAT